MNPDAVLDAKQSIFLNVRTLIPHKNPDPHLAQRIDCNIYKAKWKGISGKNGKKMKG